MSQPDPENPKGTRRTITDLQKGAISPREEGPYGVSEPDKAAPSSQKSEASPKSDHQPEADKKSSDKAPSKAAAKADKHAPDAQPGDTERFEPPY